MFSELIFHDQPFCINEINFPTVPPELTDDVITQFVLCNFVIPSASAASCKCHATTCSTRKVFLVSICVFTTTPTPSFQTPLLHTSYLLQKRRSRRREAQSENRINLTNYLQICPTRLNAERGEHTKLSCNNVVVVVVVLCGHWIGQFCPFCFTLLDRRLCQ